MGELSAVAWTVAAMLASVLWYFYSWISSQMQKDDPFAVKRCPYPDCVRCHRYAEINESAGRRLPWVLFSIKEQYPERDDESISMELQSINDAVQKGPQYRHRKRTFGQYPTVFLVQGLSAEPLVTHLYQQQAYKVLLEGDATLCQEMLDEYRNVQTNATNADKRKDFSAEWLENNVSGPGTWQVLHFMNQGVWNKTNTTLCPITTKAIQSLPDLLEGCLFGNAFVSVLHPGTDVELHCGPSNVRHRLHFALDIPKGEEVVLEVAGVKQSWESGKGFVFDDSLAHQVNFSASSKGGEHSPSKELRVVLIVDLCHPQLTEIQRSAILQLYPAPL